MNHGEDTGFFLSEMEPQKDLAGERWPDTVRGAQTLELGQDRSRDPGKRRLCESSGKGKQWAGSGLAIKVELVGLAED